MVVPSSVVAGIWMDVPFVRQPENGCGAAVTSMVLQYWSNRGHPTPVSTDVDAIQNDLYSREKHGVAASAIQEYFRDAGYQAYAFKGDAGILEEHLKRGRPLIAYLEDEGAGGFRHYVVVVGLSREAGYILVNDPAERKLKKVSWSTFEEQWAVANHWTLLALPAASR